MDSLRKVCPEVAVTTDIIVGFPGETEEDFEMTKEVVRRVEFDNAFVFRYSPRRDTPAAEMAMQHTDELKEARNQELLEVVNSFARAKSEALVGKRVEILCEGKSKRNEERLSGRTPGNKIVVLEGSERHVGQVFEVEITHSTGFTLYGNPAILG